VADGYEVMGGGKKVVVTTAVYAGKDGNGGER